MVKKKVAIIGHFGGKEDFLDGQTVKTKTLFDELSRTTEWEIIKVDTYEKKKNPIKLFLKTLQILFETKDIIILLSGNGMKVYFPLLYYTSKLLGTRIYHDVIGGNLDQYVKKYPSFKKYLNGFVVNWVETNSLNLKMQATGVYNCEVIPNFKRLNLISKDEISAGKTSDGIYKFCTFSRVMKEKGIETAIDAVEAINFDKGHVVCILDIYGPIDEEYREVFENKLKYSTSAINYLGKIPYNKSTEILKNYYALLFPTFWKGEGFPGTIIDAFSSGLPVIATDWNCNSEIIQHLVNGILYPNDQLNNLKEAMLWLMENDDDFSSVFKSNSYETAKIYQPDKYIHNIISKVGLL